MCSECWRQLTDFDHFQNTILLAQSVLNKTSHDKPENLVITPDEISAADNENDKPLISVKEEFRIDKKKPLIKVKQEFHIRDINENAVNNANDSSLPCHKENSDFTQPGHEAYAGGYEGYDNYDDCDEPVSMFPASLVDVIIGPNDSLLEETSIIADGDNNITTSDHTSGRKRRSTVDDLDQYIANALPTLACPICHEVARTFLLLTKHFKSHHPEEKCYIQCCKRTFYTRSAIVVHVRRNHPVPSNESADKTQLIKEQNPQQNKGAALEEKQTSSSLVVSPPKSSSKGYKDLDDTIAQFKPNLDCVICQGQYSTFTKLLKHFQHEHPEAKFYAECCGEKFEQRREMADHMQRHLNPDAFKCEQCSRTYSTSRHLYRHVYYSHTKKSAGGGAGGGDREKSNTAGDREKTTTTTGGGEQRVKSALFKCSECDKTFMRQASLKQHMATHAEDNKKNLCIFCNETFPDTTVLFTHVKSVHMQDSEA